MLKQATPISKQSAADGARPRMSYATFLEEWEGCELPVEWVNGEVVTMAPVSDEHSDEQVFLQTVMKMFVDAHDLGQVRSEPFQMKTGPDLPGRAPDVLFVARKNVGRLKRNHLQGPADLVVEIISPGSQKVDRKEKYAEYQAGGVREYWLIDPPRKKAEFYLRGRDGRYRLATIEDGIFRSTILKGLWLKVDWLWRKPLPSVIDIAKEWKLI
jgi:Uma2 family endonuclease